MNIALTGSTGFVGSHVLTELVAHGHEVTALVRDEAEAIAVTAKGAQATVVDLYDRVAVVTLLTDLDGSIHTASPGDATSADLDSAVADAVIEAFSVVASHTFRSAVCGSTDPTTTSPKTPPATRRRWWRGKSRLNAVCSVRKA
jgi:uncharacterized protein YbjT (DUF2867 family)